MTPKIKKVKLKGNESFNFREGWLRKGMRCIEEDEFLFSRDDVTERLGVGSKMAKSIRYWLQATGLCREHTAENRAKFQKLTPEFGRIIFDYDPYFDDVFTLFLLHYHIVSNATLCMPWNIFFNEYDGQNFTKENMVSVCRELLVKKMGEGCSFSEKSFEDDCASILRMYSNAGSAEEPEDSLSCPLGSLGLLQKAPSGLGTFLKCAPSHDELDKMAVLYVMVDNLPKGKSSVSMNELQYAPNNIGRIFNLDRTEINNYLDKLRNSDIISITRTAGLDMVYINQSKTTDEIMTEYYTKALVD